MALPTPSRPTEHPQSVDHPESTGTGGLLHAALIFLERKDPIQPARIVLLSLIPSLILAVVIAYQDNIVGRLQTETGLLLLGAKVAVVTTVMLIGSAAFAYVVSWLQKRN